MSDTRFEEYEKKTRVIFTIMGIIAFVLFLLGLVVISMDNENYDPESEEPTFIENQSIVPDIEDEGETEIIQEDYLNDNRQKAIVITPEEVNMRTFTLGVDAINQSILTISTDGKESIHIEKVELVAETEDGFSEFIASADNLIDLN